MSKNTWHAGRIMLALASRLDWFQNRMMPEFHVDGGRADLVFITRSFYLTEVEIKVSLSDWNADQAKQKFKRPRPHVSRFFYAFPETLEQKIPEWVPEGVGLISVRAGQYRDFAHEIRPAKRVRATKMTEQTIQQINDACYFRYWRQQLSMMRQRRSKNPILEAVAA